MTAEQWVQVISLTASLVSVLLAFFAIWLSWKFYEASSASNEQMKEAARAIQNGVSQLDRLFGSLYADTFGMMRETYGDIRKRAFELPATTVSESAIKVQVDERIAVLREELHKEVEQIAPPTGTGQSRQTAVREQVERVVDKAITGTLTAEADARAEALMSSARNFVMYSLGGGDLNHLTRGKKTVAELLSFPPMLDYVGEFYGEKAIKQLRQDGIISIEGEFAPSAEVELTDLGRTGHLEMLARGKQEEQLRRERVRQQDARLRANDQA